MVKRFKRSGRSRIPAKYRSGGWVGLARKAIKGYRYLKSVLNVEYKTYDRYSHTNITPNSSGEVYQLTNIAQGVNDGERNGNSVLAKSVQLQCVLKQNSAQTQATACRCILFVDKQKTPPSAVTDVLKTASVDSLFKTTNHDRFHILADKRFSLPVTADGPDKIIKIYRRLHHHVKWTGASGSDYDEGHINVLFLTDQGANLPTWYISSRFRYVDN